MLTVHNIREHGLSYCCRVSVLLSIIVMVIGTVLPVTVLPPTEVSVQPKLNNTKTTISTSVVSGINTSVAVSANTQAPLLTDQQITPETEFNVLTEFGTEIVTDIPDTTVLSNDEHTANGTETKVTNGTTSTDMPTTEHTNSSNASEKPPTSTYRPTPDISKTGVSEKVQNSSSASEKTPTPTSDTPTTDTPNTITPNTITPKTGAPKTGLPKTGAPKTGTPEKAPTAPDVSGNTMAPTAELSSKLPSTKHPDVGSTTAHKKEIATNKAQNNGVNANPANSPGSSGSTTGIVVGICFALVFAITVVGIFLYIRRRRFANNYGRLDEDRDGSWSAFSRNPIYRTDDYQQL